MPFITGSFSGKITHQSALPLTDQPNHNLSIGEVTGTQKSDDPLWNNANITYWAVTDLIDGEGSQRGYYNNVHGDKGHERGTFEGRVTGGGASVEGTWRRGVVPVNTVIRSIACSAASLLRSLISDDASA